MTPKTFWTYFLRIFGLYLIWQSLIVLPGFISNLINIPKMDIATLFTTISGLVFILSFYVAVLRYCIFKTGYIIQKLNLADGYDEEKIELNIERSNLLTMAVIIIGGLMLADAIPLFFYYVFQYFQNQNNYSGFSDNHASPWLISNLLKGVVAYLMLTESRAIVNFIERKSGNTTAEPDSEDEV